MRETNQRCPLGGYAVTFTECECRGWGVGSSTLFAKPANLLELVVQITHGEVVMTNRPVLFRKHFVMDEVREICVVEAQHFAIIH